MKDAVIIRRNTINLIFTLIGVALLGYTIYQGVKDYLDEQKSVSVDAIINSISPGTFGNNASLTYEVEGKQYTKNGVSLGFKKNLTVGDRTKIKYNINNPIARDEIQAETTFIEKCDGELLTYEERPAETEDHHHRCRLHRGFGSFRRVAVPGLFQQPRGYETRPIHRSYGDGIRG